MEANRASPVVYGSVTGPEGSPTGIFYRLKDDRAFELTSADCAAVGLPKWDLEGLAT